MPRPRSTDPKKMAKAEESRRRRAEHPEDAVKAKERMAAIMADPERRERQRAEWRRQQKGRPRYPWNPEKDWARGTLFDAIRWGRITRPDKCQACGGADGRIEAHHTDYSRPLDVEWLCSLCHGKRHRKE